MPLRRRLFRRLRPNLARTPVVVIYLIYLAALAMTTALLVFWVAVVQRFNVEVNNLLTGLGVEWSYFHTFVQTSGAGLFFLVIVALTYLLALTLSERRTSHKQEQFLSNVTHELKTPVAAIKLNAQTIQQGDLDEEELERFASFINQEADRIAILVDNLLEGSRLAAGGGAGELRPVNLGEIVRDYEEAAEARFDLRKIELVFTLDSQSMVKSNPEALHRILDNLIDNALRFTAPGGRIDCRVRDLGDQVEIVVADDGVGIPKRELPRIFDRFYRLRREIGGSRRRGTGLGLAIVRGLVEEMGGTIRAFSPEDEPGTRFEIRLPRVTTEAKKVSP